MYVPFLCPDLKLQITSPLLFKGPILTNSEAISIFFIKSVPIPSYEGSRRQRRNPKLGRRTDSFVTSNIH